MVLQEEVVKPCLGLVHRVQRPAGQLLKGAINGATPRQRSFSKPSKSSNKSVSRPIITSKSKIANKTSNDGNRNVSTKKTSNIKNKRNKIGNNNKVVNKNVNINVDKSRNTNIRNTRNTKVN
jgi:hypothetical protein